MSRDIVDTTSGLRPTTSFKTAQGEGF
jgi:hypothetical protein